MIASVAWQLAGPNKQIATEQSEPPAVAAARTGRAVSNDRADDPEKGGLARFGGRALDRRAVSLGDGSARREYLIAPAGSKMPSIRLTQTWELGESGSERLAAESAVAADQFLARLAGEWTAVELEAFLSAQGEGRLSARPLGNGWFAVRGQAESLAHSERLEERARRALAGVAVAFEADGVAFAAAVLPGDPHFADGMQWSLRNTGQDGGLADADIDAPEAWESGTDASGVVVAVLDTGIRYTHEDLVSNLWTNPGEIAGDGIDNDGNGVIDDARGYDAVSDSGDPMDTYQHGTHVASVIGARGDNGKGVAGVAWDARLMAVKCLTDGGWGLVSDIAAGIDYAIANGANALNLSWTTDAPSAALKEALERADDAGAVVVCAAGNDGSDSDAAPSYPASFQLPHVITVGSSDRRDAVSQFSNYGATTVDLFAPGEEIGVASTGLEYLRAEYTSDNGYRRVSGTSLAAAHVTGSVALLMAAFPEASNVEIVARILAGADRKASFEFACRSGGRLNVQGSLALDAVGSLPIFADQPESASVELGGSSVLSVALEGAEPVAIQWYRNGVAIVGAEQAELEIDALDEASAGEYFAVARSGLGATRSAVAVVEIARAPELRAQPAGALATLGGSAEFQARAEGLQPLTYQWLKDGAPIEGASASSFSVAEVSEADVGAYAVIVSNALGSVQSEPAKLAVTEFRTFKNWQSALPQPLGGAVDLCYGDGLFVAVGETNEIFASEDGAEWVSSHIPLDRGLHAVEFANGQFFAVGRSGAWASSSDGARWTVGSRIGYSDLRGVAFGNGRWVVVGDEVIAYSDDKVSWTVSAYPGDLVSVAFGDDMFVAVGDSGEVATSADGAAWESIALEGPTFRAVARGQGLWLAVGQEAQSAALYRSGDAIEWERVASVSQDGAGLRDVVATADGFVAVGSGSLVAYSKNGYDWSVGIATGDDLAVAYADGVYAALGASGAVALTEEPWHWPVPLNAASYKSEKLKATSVGLFVLGRDVAGLARLDLDHRLRSIALPEGHRIVDLIEAGDELLAFSVVGAVLRSSDGLEWKVAQALEGVSWRAAARLGAKSIAVGKDLDTSAHAVYRSLDGTAWEAIGAIGDDVTIHCLAQFDELLVAGGEDAGGDVVLWSLDGAVWTRADGDFASTHAGIRRIVEGNGVLLASSNGQYVYRSTNGVDWERVEAGYGGAMGDVAFGGGKFLRQVHYDVWEASTDGLSWSLLQSPQQLWSIDVAHDGNAFVSLYSGELCVSKSGYEWEVVTESARRPRLAFFPDRDGAVGVVGFGDLFRMSAGGGWSVAQLPGEAQAVAYGNGRYVTPGADTPTGTRGVMNSEDGQEWVLAPLEYGGAVRKLKFLNGRFLGFGPETAGVSEDGVEWSFADSESLEGIELTDIAFGNGVYVALGLRRSEETGQTTHRHVLSSGNGLSWAIQLELPYSHGAFDQVVFGGGTFVAISDFDKVLVSPDGAEWETVALPEDARAICYADDRFVLASAWSALLFSEDGRNWSRSLSNFPESGLERLHYADGTLWGLSARGLFRSVPIEWEEAPSLANTRVAYSSPTGALALDLLSRADSILAREDLRISWVGEASQGSATIDDSGTRLDFSDDQLRYIPAEDEVGRVDGFAARISTPTSVASNTSIIRLERMPAVSLEDGQRYLLSRDVDLVQLELPLSEDGEILSVSAEQGAARVVAKHSIEYEPRGMSDTLAIAYRDGEERAYSIAIDFAESIAASDDVAFVFSEASSWIPILDNDTIIDSRRIASVDVIQQPERGTAHFDAESGQLRYVVEGDFYGREELRYRVIDANGDSSEATVEVQVFLSERYKAWSDLAFAATPDLTPYPWSDSVGAGLTNFERYAFGYAATEWILAEELRPRVSVEGGMLSLVAVVTDDPDLVVVLEILDTALGWRPATVEADGLEVEELDAPSSPFPLDRLRFKVNLGESGAIARLRVSWQATPE